MTTLTRVSAGPLFVPELVGFPAEPGCGFIAFAADPQWGSGLSPSITFSQGLCKGRFLLCDAGFWAPPAWNLLQRAVASWNSSAAFSNNLILLCGLSNGQPVIKDGLLGDVQSATVRDDTIAIEDWSITVLAGPGGKCVLEAPSDDMLRIKNAQSITLAGGSGNTINASLALVQAKASPGRPSGWTSAQLVMEGTANQRAFAGDWNPGMSYYFGEAPPVRLPLLSPWVKDVRLDLSARLNPYRHWHGDPFSSSVRIMSMESGGTQLRAFLSTLRIADGTPVYLSPANAAFVVQPQTDGLSDLVPAGKFAIQVGSKWGYGTAIAPLMLGGAGTEFMHISNDPELPDALEFVPGMNAYSPIDMNARVKRKLKQPAWLTRAYGGALPADLTDFRKTSWTRLVSRRGMLAEFVLQPHEAPAYSPAAPKPTPRERRSYDAAWGFAKSVLRAKEEPPLIPLSPADGIDFSKVADRDAYGFLEQTVLSRVRVRTIGQSSSRILSPMGAGPDEWITTPQGFLARVQNGVWQEIRIASSFDEKEGTLLDLTFHRPQGTQEWAFEEALRHAEVFLVMSFPLDPTQYGAIGRVEATVTVRGWKFNLLLPEPAQGQTSDAPAKPPVLVLKFGRKSAESLVSEFTAWLFPDVFNRAGTARSVQQGLQKDIAEYKRRAASGNADQKEMYRGFKERITADGWNGVMVFDALPDGFPDQAAALEAGIVKSTFSAPYFGIDTNRIDQLENSKSLVITRTAFFGLVDYEYQPPLSHPAGRKTRTKQLGGDPILRGYDENRYGTRVERLAVLIEDSSIRRFDALLTLRLGSMAGGDFEEKPKRKGSNEFLHDLKIRGRYETRMRDGRTEDIYTFFNEGGSRKLQFGPSNPILESLAVDRVELRSTVTKGTPETVAARFAVTGKLSFKKTQGDLLSLDELGFSNTAVTLTFDRTFGDVAPKFGFEAGAVQAEVRASRPGGLLERIGAELRGFVWSGRSRAEASASSPFKLPKFPHDFGYFDLKFPGIDLKDGFDFGLEVEVALGGLGKLLGLQHKLTGRVLLGWQWNVGKVGMPALGFKLSGVEGKLEIGIQGVLRFVAKEVALLTAGDLPKGLTAALALSGAFVEILGKAVPEAENITLMLVFPESGPAGWLVAGSNYKLGGGFEIPVLMLGQRMDWLANSGAPWNARELVVQARKNILQAPLNEPGDGASVDPGADGNKFKQRVIDLFAKSHLAYDRDTDWSVATQVKLGDAADVHLVMSDEKQSLYGVHVTVPATVKKLIDVDVLYRKITDEVGLYAIEIAPPAEFRRMDLTAVTVVLGNLGLDLYTNGNWRLDLGYPRGRDYSRSFSAEVFPFIGFGGAYFGEKSADVLRLVPGDWDHANDGHYEYSPVIEFGLAGRFGLGKTIERGIFRAGVSLTLYGTLEGAFGRLHEISALNPAPRLAAVHWRLVGTAGILFEGYAVVDFSIIKFGFMLAAWAEAGLALEPRREIKVSVELGVSVSLRLVIARIDIPFDGTLEIAVDLHFEAKIQQEWSLGTLNIQPASLPTSKLRLSNNWGVFAYFAQPRRVQLYLTRDYSLETVTNAGKEEPEAKLQATLLCSTELLPSGELAAAALLVASLAWGLKPLLDQSYGGDWNKLSLSPAELQPILDTLEARGAKGGPSYSQIAAFFARNFEFLISHPASARPADGSGKPAKGLVTSHFPVFPELTFSLNDREDSTGHGLDMPGAVLVNPGYEDELRKYFEDAIEQLEDRDARISRKKNATMRQASELVFEDWYLSLLRAAMRFVIQAAQEKPVNWLDLEHSLMVPSPEKLDALRAVFAEAAALHLAGLRVPAPGARLQSWAQVQATGKRRPRSNAVDASAMPLVALTGQQIGLPWLDTQWPAKGTLYLQARSTAAWIVIDPSQAVHQGAMKPYLWAVDREVMAALVADASAIGNQVQLEHLEQLPPAQPSPLEIAFGPRCEVGGANPGALWLIPENQAPSEVERAAAPLAARLLLRERPETVTASGVAHIAEQDMPYAPASAVEIIIRQTEARTGNHIAFEIVGGNYRAQRHLESLANAIASGDAEFYLPPELLPPFAKDDYVKHVDSVVIGKALGAEPASPGIHRGPRQSLRLQQDEGPWVYRSNLARITQPPISMLARAPDEAAYLASLALEEDLSRALTMLKDASALSSGGYWLICGKRLGLDLADKFGAKPELALTLLLKSKRAPLAGNEHVWSDSFNAVFVKQAALQGTDTPPHVSVLAFNRSVLRPTQPHGWLRFRPQRSSGSPHLNLHRFAQGPRTTQQQEIHEGLLESAPRKFDLMEISTEGTATFEPISPNRIVPFTRADAKDNDRYNVALPIKNFLKASKPGDRNPYDGIGERITVKFGLRDVYGNRLPNYEKRTEAELRYFDRLVPVSELPGVRLSYSFPGSGNAVQVALRFETAVLRCMLQDAYKTRGKSKSDDPEAIVKDRLKELAKRFAQCKDQLDPGNKASVAIKFDGPLVGAVEPANRDVVRFLADILDLVGAVQAKTGTVLARWCDEKSSEKPDVVTDVAWSVQLRLNIDLTKPRPSLSPSDLALIANIVVKRDNSLLWVDAAGKSVEGSAQAASKIYPTYDHKQQLADDAAWDRFAERIERQFVQLKVARLVDRRVSGTARESTEVYLVPQELTNLHVATDPSQVVACATRPLRRSLASGQAQVLLPGQGQAEKFVKDVDFDDTMRRFTELLERSLLPAPGRSDTLPKLARAVHVKSELAGLFKPQLTWVTRASNIEINERTRYVAWNEFLRDLAVAFAPGVFLQVPMDIAPRLHGLNTASVFGRVEIREMPARVKKTGEPVVAFSTMMKVPLGNRTSDTADAAFFVPRRAYANGTRPEINGTLAFEPRYLQIAEDAGRISDLDVAQSKWLELVRPNTQAWIQKQFKARLPARSVPRPPKIDEQKAKFTGSVAAVSTPNLSWEYSVALTPADSTVDKDMLAWTIEYPAPIAERSARVASATPTLFDCLASIRENLESGDLGSKPEALDLLLREGYRLLEVLRSPQSFVLSTSPIVDTIRLVFNESKNEWNFETPRPGFSRTNNPLVLTRSGLPMLERQAAFSRFKVFSNLLPITGVSSNDAEFVYESQEIAAGEPVSPCAVRQDMVVPRAASQSAEVPIRQYLAALLGPISEKAPLSITVQSRLGVPKGGGPRPVADPIKDTPDRYWYFHPLVLVPNLTLGNAADVQSFATRLSKEIADVLNGVTIDLAPGQRRALSLDITVRGGPFEKIGRVSLIDLKNAFVPI